jgi:glycosyltransferase involved in cell wall biosynthesis
MEARTSVARETGRILIDARLLAYRRGGINRYIAGLVEWLPRVAPDLDFGRLINRPTGPSKMDDVRVRTPPHFRFERAAFGVEVTTRRPSLLHSPDFIAPVAVGSRRVVTVHDLAFLRSPDLLADDAHRYYGQIERSLAVADRVIAVSDYTARQLCELTKVDPAKIVTIPNGVEKRSAEMSRDDVSERLRRGLRSDVAETVLGERPRILVVGTIEPRKRQQLILQALENSRTSGDRLEPLVVLVGQRGWACESIVADIDRAVNAGRAIWIENANDEVLEALYEHATLLAMPSLDEGFGLPVLEAMAAGLTVVAARRGALPEVAGDAAVLVDDDDPDSWAAALATLIADKARREDLRRAGRFRAGQFSWERTATETAALYREVLKH